MVTGSENRLDSRSILKRVSEYDIYRYYLGNDFKPGKLFPSPFRSEKNGSFNIFYTKTGYLRHKDFGDSYYQGNCFQFVQQLYGLDYHNALLKISLDFNLGLGVIKKEGIDYGSLIKESLRDTSVLQESIYSDQSSQEVYHKKTVKIHVRSKQFTVQELDYWKKFGIEMDELERNQIYSVDELYIDGKLIRNWNKGFRFAYYYKDENTGEEFFKIYSPYSVNYKWISNVPVKRPFNLSLLSKGNSTIILAKSKKDKMIIEKIHPWVYEVQKEGKEVISPELDSFFDEYYEQKLCFFDSDIPGKKASMELNDLGYGWINIPNDYLDLGIKDPGDLIEYFGIEDGMKLLEIIIKKKLIEQKSI